jgi:hypothetical protein
MLLSLLAVAGAVGFNSFEPWLIARFLERIAGVSECRAMKIEPESLTIQDFSDISGVTQEYVDAYKVFLNAHSSDNSGSGYKRAAEAFETLARKTDNPELKLRALYLAVLSQFLQKNISEAYRVGREVVALSKKLYADRPEIARMDQIIGDIEKGKIRCVMNLKDKVPNVSGSLFALENDRAWREDLFLFSGNLADIRGKDAKK